MSVKATFSDDSSPMTAKFASSLEDIEFYAGAASFTPSGVSQTIPVSRKYCDGNITINPIPSNYGLVTYFGNKTISVI